MDLTEESEQTVASECESDLPERFDLRSVLPTDERYEAIRDAFPEVFRQDKIDFEALKRSLGEWVDPGPERFGLMWPGKAECMRIIQEPSIGTLVPMPEESVDWDRTQNVIIEGENLEVLKLLQKAYYGKVKLIYIDPPYNTGKEFIYPDNFREGLADYLRYSGQVDEEGFKTSANPETAGRYHSKWLSMMYPRLFLARNLLREDGVIFVSIDDHELHNLRALMNEVFGEENFVGMITRSTGTPTGGGFEGLVNIVDYVLVFARSVPVRLKGLALKPDDEAIYNQEDEQGRYLTRPLRRTGGEDRREDRPSMYYPVEAPDGSLVYPIGPGGYESRWRCSKSRYAEYAADGLIEWTENGEEGPARWTPFLKFYLEGRTKQPSNLWSDIAGNKKGTREVNRLFDGERVFESPKPTDLIMRMLSIATEPDDIVLDFFAGSGSTGHAVFRQNASDGGNRRFVLVQLPEPVEDESFHTIAEITRERVRRAALDVDSREAVDLGFRSYRLTTSNFRVWDGSIEVDVEQQLEMSTDHVVSNASSDSVLAELLLKAGFELTTPVEEFEVQGGRAYSIADGQLVVYLDSDLSLEAVEDLVDLEPSLLLIADSAFGHDDELKVNAVQTVRSRNLGAGSDITLKVV